MSDGMDENKYWLTLWMSLSFSVVVLILGLVYLDKTKTVELAELGYERTTIVGHATSVFQKVR